MSTYMDAYNKWIVDQSPENMARLVDSFMPTINSEIQRFEGSKPLLRSKAKALTIKAIRSYNPMSGAKLQSWVTTNLQPLSRYGQQQRSIHVPEMALRQAAEVNRVSKDLSDELGRDPTDEELSDEIGISVKRIKSIRQKAMPTVNSGSTEVTTDTEGASGGEFGVSEVDQIPFAREAVYMSLNDRDKKIFDMRTGSHGSKTYSAGEIAARMGLSPASISQRANYIASQISNIANR